jgi:hypothetical protein
VIGVRVIAAQDVLPEWPQIGFDAAQIIRRDQVAVRVIRPAIGCWYQSHDFLHIARVAHKYSATFSRIRSFTLPPDVLDQGVAQP